MSRLTIKLVCGCGGPLALAAHVPWKPWRVLNFQRLQAGSVGFLVSAPVVRHRPRHESTTQSHGRKTSCDSKLHLRGKEKEW